MNKRTGFKMGESELTLLGNEIKVGDQAPEFTVVKPDLSPLTLADLGDKIKIIAAVPSVDTKVCELETIRFNEEAARLGHDVVILTISVDLPFALDRFCAAEAIENAIVASDYQNRDFAEKYGVLIDGLFLLNRSVFVLDRDNKVVYVAYNEQNVEHPNYDAVLDAVKGLLA